ncbi:hypothetical protein Lfu02_72680 [Longispora fulva]|uniref:Uncharacterized protein n=1 Tax=Longispora fulva TaxID=619741 RepID=A0A8J7GAM9_9ACTN|nr:hypothetical protein [Longispora fulva]MBG6133856.1 hypothetical protein [Longispora fulva]GIG62896.1 hypothetical protein Lfu02_72680 [Longispora fulva]
MTISPSAPPGATPPEPVRPARLAPFAAALHRAIEHRDLSLEQLRARLAEAGIPVSMSTLSLWRRGLRRPERAQSLRAVVVLEKVLGLPGDSLVALLGPRRRRGRSVATLPAVGFSRLFETRHLLADFGAGRRPDTLNPDLMSLSVHDHYEFNERGAEARVRVHHVARALGEVDRWLVHYQADDPGRPSWTGTLRAGSGCRPGRVRTDTGSRVLELLFDRALRPGDVAVFDFEITFGPGGDAQYRFARIFERPSNLYVAEVTFHPRAVPVRCHEFVQSSLDSDVRLLREVPLDDSHTARMAVQTVPAGLFGMSWEWP